MQALVQREVSRLSILRIRRLPEATAISTNVPVAELINERFQRFACRLRIVIIERLGDRGNRFMQQRQSPSIYLGTISRRDVSCQIDVIEPRIQYEKAVSIPERVDKRTGYIGNDVHRYALRHIGRQARKKIPTQRVGADRIKHVIRVDNVTDRLRHFFAVFIDDQIQTNTILVRHAVGNQRRDRV